MPRALLPPPPPQNASRFTIYYSSSLSFCIGVFFCYAQRQPDDILLPFVRKVYEEGYKEETSTLGCLPYKSNNWGKTVKSIFGRKKQKEGRSVIYFGTHACPGRHFFVFVWRFKSPLSLFFLFLDWEKRTHKNRRCYTTLYEMGWVSLGFCAIVDGHFLPVVIWWRRLLSLFSQPPQFVCLFFSSFLQVTFSL